MYNLKLTNSHHPDGLVVAPKHIVANHERVHRRLDAVGRVAQTALGQVGRNQVVLDEILRVLVGNAAHRLKTDGRSRALETVA